MTCRILKQSIFCFPALFTQCVFEDNSIEYFLKIPKKIEQSVEALSALYMGEIKAIANLLQILYRFVHLPIFW